MTILVSGASGVVGYGILKSLKGYKLIGTTIYDFSIAPAFCNVAKTILPTDDYFYIDNLCDIIEDYHVDLIIPSIECDVLKWNEERFALSEITVPVLNNSELIKLCSDKWLFYQTLVSGCPKYAIPTTLGNDFNPYAYPFLLKPRTSYGSKGIIRINSSEEYEFYRSPLNWKHMIVQPIIGNDNEEYTVSGFFDLNSNLIDYFPLRRKLLNGSTNEAIVEDRNFGEVLTDLAKVFKPVGPTNFQFRFDGDSPKLLEINPRISSATSIRTAFGYNESQMSVDYFLHDIKPKPFNKPYGRKAIRYTEDYIF
jgi:carbamoyl-phosphate synthase large subunit